METKITYKSEFLPEVNVGIIYPEDPSYVFVAPLFKNYGYGFMVPEGNLIIIDGGVVGVDGTDLTKLIEAHECAHIILSHNKETTSEQELEADLGAYILLERVNRLKSIELLLENFEIRHNMSFDGEMVKTLKNRFS